MLAPHFDHSQVVEVIPGLVTPKSAGAQRPATGLKHQFLAHTRSTAGRIFMAREVDYVQTEDFRFFVPTLFSPNFRLFYVLNLC